MAQLYRHADAFCSPLNNNNYNNNARERDRERAIDSVQTQLLLHALVFVWMTRTHCRSIVQWWKINCLSMHSSKLFVIAVAVRLVFVYGRVADIQCRSQHSQTVPILRFTSQAKSQPHTYIYFHDAFGSLKCLNQTSSGTGRYSNDNNGTNRSISPFWLLYREKKKHTHTTWTKIQ